ncbi:phosphoserine aminotransferase [Tribonema minus]|uniref:D-3-phosphoglycerate dehydrogenase n=1 Tax=Tribonema minus TaxID=303371 RepID=A0A835YXH9_9STRA|nr:phosphoserine aminotransferase [Tribonema minus]
MTRSAQLTRGIERRLVSSTRPALAKILIGDPTDAVCANVFVGRGHEVDKKPGLSKEELLQVIGEYDGLVVRSGVQVDKDVIEAGKNLRIVGRAGTGVDNIDVQAATSKGVLVMNTPGGNTASTAELAMTHILALARNIPSAVASMKAGRWDRKKYMGTELMGKTVGVIGLGRIGREVAAWCTNFGMTAIGYDPILTDAAARASGIEPVPLEEIFKRSDFITLHTPLTQETRNLISKANLAKCRKGVRIVNCARGPIVNPADLLEALESGQVAGASLDVYPSEPPPAELEPLIQHPHVICTPHLGASTTDAQVRVARDIASQMCDVLDGGEFVGVLNAPNMAFARKSKLSSYVKLGEKMGALQAQLLGNAKVRSMRITLHGKDLAVPEMTGPMSAAILKGALNHLLAQEVNYVNAVALGKELGLSIEVAFSQEDPSGYTNGLTVEFEIDGLLNGRRTVAGTCFGRELRVTSIDSLDIDFLPTGNMIFLNNPDTPGMLRQVSSALARGGVNIANFALGRVRQGGTAMSCISVDGPVPENILADLRAIPGVRNVIPVNIGEMEDPAFRIDDEEFQGVVYGTPMPADKPANPEFSSGPCKKRPGYSLQMLPTDCLGRSHRSKLGKARLKYAIEETKRLLGVPSDYLVGIVPASDTGAYEMAMWNMLGPRPIDACYWESFGKGWFTDAVTHLGLKEQTRAITVDGYGRLPDLSQTSPDHDIMFTWNGTTSGVKVPNGDWISSDRTGLTLNDATSAAFAMDIPWDKVDVTTYSWQKVLGGEGAHGVMILSPRAVERLETYVPENRPLPKIFRMTKKGKVDRSIFEGSTINTPSMLCVEDYIDALAWTDSSGGVPGLIKRSQANLSVIESFVAKNDWINFLAEDPATRSNTSVCLTLDLDAAQVKRVVAMLEKEGVAYDIGSYRDAPPGLRIWCGATVEKEDLEALMPWLEWAYTEVKSS